MAHYIRLWAINVHLDGDSWYPSDDDGAQDRISRSCILTLDDMTDGDERDYQHDAILRIKRLNIDVLAMEAKPGDKKQEPRMIASS